MINIRIEEKPSFEIAGRKIWISGQDNEQFGLFWKESHENGLISNLRDLCKNTPGIITGGYVFGVSCVEKDPNNRAFNFYIAAEIVKDSDLGSLEHYVVPACKWAVFSNTGELPMSLINAEMYAFTEWLPSSQYQHDYAPELEVYPARNSSLVEFWLPITDK